MRVLIACEYSGIVRDAFLAKGHDAISCDILSTESPGPHYQGDVMDLILDEENKFDMMIAFPPCTFLTCTANRSFLNNPDRWEKRLEAMYFVWDLMNCNIPRICIENPKGVISSHIRKPDQYIQPYHYGHKESKTTGLWLKNLPLLVPTNIVEPEWIISLSGKRHSPTHWKNPSTNNPGNAKLRSKTYDGIAAAMANQWSNLK